MIANIYKHMQISNAQTKSVPGDYDVIFSSTPFFNVATLPFQW